MLWAIGSSIFVIYLYRTLNAPTAAAPDSGHADTLEAELAALNAQIAALENEAGRAVGSATP